MSADLQLFSENAVPSPAPRDFVSSYGKWYNVLWMLVFLVISLGFFGMALYGSFGQYLPDDLPLLHDGTFRQSDLDSLHSPVRFLFYVIALFFYGFYRMAKSFAVSARTSSNWLLRGGADGLYVKYRSYLNHDFDRDEPAVLFIPYHLVDNLRGHILRGWTVASTDSGNTMEQGRRQDFIEIRLRKVADLAMIGEALKAERNHDSVGEGVVKGKVLHYPVRLMEGGVVRLDWSGLRPKLKPALKALDFWYTILPLHEGREDARADMSEKALEDKLLGLVMEGDDIAANRLARDLYGYSTTEATRFIDSLLEDSPAVPAGDSVAEKSS